MGLEIQQDYEERLWEIGWQGALREKIRLWKYSECPIYFGFYFMCNGEILTLFNCGSKICV